MAKSMDKNKDKKIIIIFSLCLFTFWILRILLDIFPTQKTNSNLATYSPIPIAEIVSEKNNQPIPTVKSSSITTINDHNNNEYSVLNEDLREKTGKTWTLFVLGGKDPTSSNVKERVYDIDEKWICHQLGENKTRGNGNYYECGYDCELEKDSKYLLKHNPEVFDGEYMTPIYVCQQTSDKYD